MNLLLPPPSVLRPALREPLRHFVQAAFSQLDRDVAAGQEVPFAIEEIGSGEGPRLYDYRPLYGQYVEQRSARLRALADYRRAVEAVAADAGALAYARAHASDTSNDEECVRRVLLWPLLVRIAERQAAFDYSDEAFDAAYGGVEQGVVRTRHRFEALVPLVGVLVSNPPVELGAGVELRRASADDLTRDWPEAQGLVPARFGREPDRLCALLVTADLDPKLAQVPPDATALATAAVMALRLVSGGAIAAGSLLFEHLDLAPRAIRPLPPEAASVPRGEAVRLDQHALSVARSLCERLAAAPGEPDALGLALTRYAVAAGVGAPLLRAGALLAAIAPLLGGEGAGDALALRAASLAGRTAGERQAIAAALRDTARRSDADAGLLDDGRAAELENAVDVATRAVLIAALLDDRRGASLAATLDEVLLGARPRPQLVPNGIAALAA